MWFFKSTRKTADDLIYKYYNSFIPKKNEIESRLNDFKNLHPETLLDDLELFYSIVTAILDEIDLLAARSRKERFTSSITESQQNELNIIRDSLVTLKNAIPVIKLTGKEYDDEGLIARLSILSTENRKLSMFSEFFISYSIEIQEASMYLIKMHDILEKKQITEEKVHDFKEMYDKATSLLISLEKTAKGIKANSAVLPEDVRNAVDAGVNNVLDWIKERTTVAQMLLFRFLLIAPREHMKNLAITGVRR